jgi:hypothetical protein
VEDGEGSVKKTHGGLANRGRPLIEVENVKKGRSKGHLDFI